MNFASNVVFHHLCSDIITCSVQSNHCQVNMVEPNTYAKLILERIFELRDPSEMINLISAEGKKRWVRDDS